MTARFNDEEHLLEQGDSISFDSSKNHSVENTGEDEALLIWTVTPHNFKATSNGQHAHESIDPAKVFRSDSVGKTRPYTLTTHKCGLSCFL
ncbi:cupin domain-containing protein [Brevibacillus choshinensis]|uniref:cupin domain-containing protein n=1 Tax=Brevibacillus choshinensis TaxID=54911 RepID=UPI001EEEBD57|nr:cupin domain-containing protein [Brevibacillus choshinensis]